LDLLSILIRLYLWRHRSDILSLMTVRNGRMASGTLTANTYTVVYTTPANFVLLLKSVVIYNGGTGSAGASLIVTDPAGPTNVLFASTNINATFPYLWSGEIHLNGGDELTLNVTGGGCTYWVSGAQLPYSTP
jgi:hypothetical protein